jgi:polysaccharide biosynthesis/export protein
MSAVLINFEENELQKLKVFLIRGMISGIFSIFFSISYVEIAVAAYGLKAGDKLEISVFQEPKLNRVVTVGPDGRIALPLVGHLSVGGTTVESVERKITLKLREQYPAGVDVTVALFEVKEKPVFPPVAKEKPIDPSFYVTGEVPKPGQYLFNRPTDVLQGIAMAGGLGPFAAAHRVKVRRKIGEHEQLFDFDYANFIAGEDASGNIRLHHGDVIIVPEKKLFE